MTIKPKIVVIITIILFSSYIFDSIYGAGNENTNEDLEERSYKDQPLVNDDIFWGQIEVISEPVSNQDINNRSSGAPSIAIENGNIYVVWRDFTDINSAGTDTDIFYRFFNGTCWGDIQVISEPILGQNYNNINSGNPDIAVDNGKIYIIWNDGYDYNSAGSDNDIFFRCNLTGKSWEDIQVISEPVPGQDFNIGAELNPVIEVENGNIYTAWTSENDTDNSGTNSDVFYRCNISGSGWKDVQVISEPEPGNDFTGGAFAPRIAVENSKIYVVWREGNDTNGAGTDWDIFFRCNLTGISWEDIQVISEPVQGQNINTGASRFPDIAVENGNIYTVWWDVNDTYNANTDADIFYKCNLSGIGWEPVQVISEPVPGQNHNPVGSFNPKIAVNNSKIYVVWYDENFTNGAGTDNDIFFLCNISGTGWEPIQVISEPVPGQNINTGESIGPSIAVENGKIFAVWRDDNNTNGAGVDNDIFFRGTMPPLNLLYPTVKPITGNTGTYFNFTVLYLNLDNKAPSEILVNIDGTDHNLIETNTGDTDYTNGKKYFFNLTDLDIGIHNFYFNTFDGVNSTSTPTFYYPFVYNTRPDIITEDNQTAIEDMYYEVQYKFEDIDHENVDQPGTWAFSTNASWLDFNRSTGILFGTPGNDDVGDYWVYVEINDTMDMDYTNFTLTVINENDDPIIVTTDVEITYEDELYEVDYNATDIDSPIAKQLWSLSSNASSWLDINSSSGILSGIPANDDVGSYWVNISVNDGDTGSAYSNYTLSVINVNDPPIITTEYVFEATVNIVYQVDYNATDIDSPLSQLAWDLETNATWLSLDSTTGVLSGTPSIKDLGGYDVNITVDDGDGGQDWHKFILTVNIGNLPPKITTENIVTAIINEPYEVDYNATDDKTLDLLSWSLVTNASWLNIDIKTGLLSGTPAKDDVGSYWVNVSVFDNEDGWDFTNFTINVKPELITILPPELNNPSVTPATGDTETIFTFSVDYSHPEDVPPDSIQVVINDRDYDLIFNASSDSYEFSTKLLENDKCIIYKCHKSTRY
jgi:hypothetical protein